LFDDYTPEDFTRAVMRAIDQFEEPDGWAEMIRTAMSRDFGWELSATKYLNVYHRVMGAVAAH
jgi:starch synthase